MLLTSLERAPERAFSSWIKLVSYIGTGYVKLVLPLWQHLLASRALG